MIFYEMTCVITDDMKNVVYSGDDFKYVNINNSRSVIVGMKKISVVIGTFNEELNIEAITDAVEEQLINLGKYDYEIIIIDNDSTDSTRQIIRSICGSNKKIKAIFNAKNYGQFNSPYYGMLQTSGDCVIIMAADFQDPVEMIPMFVDEWENGSKIVLGQKTTSEENRIRYMLRGFYYWFMGKYSNYGFLKQVTGFGLYDKEFIEIMRTIDDPHPFLRGIVTEMGYKVKTIPFNQPERKNGKSSNNISLYYDAAVQSITAYTKVGIRLIILCGVLFSLLSVIILTGCLVYKAINWDTWSIKSILFDLIIMTIVSLQTLFLGIVGEYVLNINMYTRKRPLVIESERINF